MIYNKNKHLVSKIINIKLIGIVKFVIYVKQIHHY
jgi:hypothetical protein